MFYQAWYKQNLQVAIPVSIVAGIVLLLILFSLLKCVKRCCCGRSKPKVVPNPPINTAIPSNVPGQRIPSWTSLQNNGNEVRRDSWRDDTRPPMYNFAPPQRAYSPPNNSNGRLSEDTTPMLQYPNPFDGAQLPSALRPGGAPSRSVRPQFQPPPLPPGAGEPSYPLPPAAPRQSTWGNAGVAGIGGGGNGGRRSGSDSGPSFGPGPDQKRTKWVDDRIYNGP